MAMLILLGHLYSRINAPYPLLLVFCTQKKRGIFITEYKCPRKDLHWNSHHRIKELPWRIKPLSPHICSFPVNLKWKGKPRPAVLLSATLGTAGQLRDYSIYHEDFLSHKITQIFMIKSRSFWAKFTYNFQYRPSKSKIPECIKQRLGISLLSLRNTIFISSCLWILTLYIKFVTTTTYFTNSDYCGKELTFCHFFFFFKSKNNPTQ